VLYNRRGVSDYVLYDEAGIHDRTGVTPVQYPEYAALRGDPSDNLPGVPGVGEKTAAKLINTYANLDGIFAHLDELTPKLRANLAAAQDQVRSNASATPLIRDVPLDVDPDSLTMGGWDTEELRRLFDFLEFRSLWDRLMEALKEGKEGDDSVPDAGEPIEIDVFRPTASEVVERLETWRREAPVLALAPAWEGRAGAPR